MKVLARAVVSSHRVQKQQRQRPETETWKVLYIQETVSLSSSQNSPGLVALPILPAWLLANQRFIKSMQVTIF